MSRKSKVWGLEFDWFAVDESGNVALFSSAGSGQVPEAALSLETRYESLRIFLGLSLGAETWQQAAGAGLFAYDCSINGGAYLLKETPDALRTVGDLPTEHRETVKFIRHEGTFGAASLAFTDSAFTVTSPNPGASGGRRASPPTLGR